MARNPATHSRKPSRAALGAMLGAMRDRYGNEPVAVSRIIADLSPSTTAAVVAPRAPGEFDFVHAARLGRVLAGALGPCGDGLALCRVRDRHARQWRYAVDRVERAEVTPGVLDALRATVADLQRQVHESRAAFATLSTRLAVLEGER